MSAESAEREVEDETLLEDRAELPELGALRAGAPEHIGRYRVLAKLGAGGFATVYLARLEGAAGFGRFVAIKRIHDHLASEPELVAMFLDEARVASAIDHPNVCAPLDFGRAEEGNYFLAMDYLLGEPLSEVRRAYGRVHGAPKPEDVAFVLRVMADAAHGLHAAHEALDTRGRPLEIVHRDVAPANLFVLFTGHVKVVDFGIAKAARKLHTTQHGVFKGHVPFAAPEQLRGRTLDRRADLWSLGVVLWEMLAKRRLFAQKDEVALVDAIVRDPIPQLREKAPWVSPRLAQTVHRCLSREIEERPSSALELALVLEEELRRLRVPMGVHEVGSYLHALLPERTRTRYRQLWALAEEAGFATSLVTSLEPDSTEVSERRLAPVAGAAADESDPDATIPLPAPVFDAPAARESVEVVSVEVTTEERSASPSTPVLPVGLDLSAFDAPIVEPEPGVRSRAKPRFLLGGVTLGILAIAVFALGRWTASPTAAAPVTTEVTPDVGRASVTSAPSPSDVAAHASGTAAPSSNVASEDASVADEAPTERRERPRTVRTGRAARPVGRGAVAVTASGGWGEVFVGGRKLGVTPGRFELPAGATTLRIVPASGRPRTVRVVVPVDGEARVRVALE
ncbi:MAG: protein kinase [Myxococcota bacterium]|jgi:serine/threonine-protein kinase|nr:protein kinase [Myxococcota bacterium]